MASWTAPRTWVANEQVTASLMNTYVSDDFSYLKDSPTFDGNVTITGTLTVGGSLITSRICESRLTLTVDVPVTVSDVTAATTVYWMPYGGNLMALYSGTKWVLFSNDGLSVAVPNQASQMYDVFVNYNGGVPALSLLAWTSDTARATALTTLNGVLVLTGTTTKRYVGSFRTTGVAGQTEDSFANRLVWNYYNRVARPGRAIDTTDSWNYSTATWRQARATGTNQVGFVVGFQEDAISADVLHLAANDGASVAAATGIGLDSTSAPATSSRMTRSRPPGAAVSSGMSASFETIPAIGYHTLVWLERDDTGGGTTTFYGDAGTTTVQSGLGVRWRA